MPIYVNGYTINQIYHDSSRVTAVTVNGSTVYSYTAQYRWESATQAEFEACAIKHYAIDDLGSAGSEILPEPTAAGWGGRIEHRHTFPPVYSYYVSAIF